MSEINEVSEKQVRDYIKYQHDIGVSGVEFFEVCDGDLCCFVYKVLATSGQEYWVAPGSSNGSFFSFPYIEGQQPAEIARRVERTNKKGNPVAITDVTENDGNVIKEDFYAQPTDGFSHQEDPVTEDFTDIRSEVKPTLNTTNSNSVTSQNFEIGGHDVQYIKCSLRPGQRVVSEPGSFLSRDDGITMETEILSDGSESGGSLVNRVISPIKRSISGENLFLLIFTNVSEHKVLDVYFAAPVLGSIVPVLMEPGDAGLCQRGGFLCGSDNIDVGPYIGSRSLPAHVFGNEGLILQRLRCRGRTAGVCYIHVGGSVIKHKINPGEAIHVDTGCLALWDAELAWNVRPLAGVNNFFFAKEGIFISSLKNETRKPLHAYVQSLPFPRMIDIIGKAHKHPDSAK